MKRDDDGKIDKQVTEKWKKSNDLEIVERADEYSVLFEEKPQIQHESIDYMNLIVNNGGQ
jgi:hypothetical protein